MIKYKPRTKLDLFYPKPNQKGEKEMGFFNLFRKKEKAVVAKPVAKKAPAKKVAVKKPVAKKPCAKKACAKKK